MKQINVIIEKTNTGYSAYSQEVPGCVATGKNIIEVKVQFAEALRYHHEGLIDDGEVVPEVLRMNTHLILPSTCPHSLNGWMA